MQISEQNGEGNQNGLVLTRTLTSFLKGLVIDRFSLRAQRRHLLILTIVTENCLHVLNQFLKAIVQQTHVHAMFAGQWETGPWGLVKDEQKESHKQNKYGRHRKVKANDDHRGNDECTYTGNNEFVEVTKPQTHNVGDCGENVYYLTTAEMCKLLRVFDKQSVQKFGLHKALQ